MGGSPSFAAGLGGWRTQLADSTSWAEAARSAAALRFIRVKRKIDDTLAPRGANVQPAVQEAATDSFWAATLAVVVAVESFGPLALAVSVALFTPVALASSLAVGGVELPSLLESFRLDLLLGQVRRDRHLLGWTET